MSRRPDAQTPGPRKLRADGQSRGAANAALDGRRVSPARGVQSQLGEQLGVKKVDKNDIIRCAIHALFEEYARNGEGSELVRRLRKKYR